MSLTPDQLDILKELVNIGVGRAGSVLSEMLDERISLSVPEIFVGEPGELEKYYGHPSDSSIALVSLPFSGSFDGKAMLFFPPPSAVTLVRLLTGEGEDAESLDSVKAGTLVEVGNIVLNGVIGSLTNLLSTTVHYGVPEYLESSIHKMIADQVDPVATILANTHFSVEHQRIKGNIMLIFSVGAFGDLIAAIDRLIAESV